MKLGKSKDIRPRHDGDNVDISINSWKFYFLWQQRSNEDATQQRVFFFFSTYILPGIPIEMRSLFQGGSVNKNAIQWRFFITLILTGSPIEFRSLFQGRPVNKDSLQRICSATETYHRWKSKNKALKFRKLENQSGLCGHPTYVSTGRPLRHGICMQSVRGQYPLLANN